MVEYLIRENYIVIKLKRSKLIVNHEVFIEMMNSGILSYLEDIDDEESRQSMRNFISGMLIVILLILIVWLILRICCRHPEMKECKDNVLESVRVDTKNINEKNSSGLAPIHVALSNGLTDKARELIERGASVNCQTTYRKNTPLHYAVNNGHPYRRGHIIVNNNQALGIDFVEFLLDKGADPNIKNFRGETPLHFVAAGLKEDSNLNILKLLVRRGAHVDMLNNYNETSLSIALKYQDDACVEELISWGASVNEMSVAHWIMADSILDLIRKPTVATKMHCAKLKAANLPRYNRMYDYYVDESLEDFYQECLLEVEVLKNTFIDDGITIYNFIHMDVNSRCEYIYNVKLKTFLEMPQLKEMFPKYAIIILGSYREMEATRKRLINQAIEAWYGVTQIYLPDVCVERIFKYMGTDDLLNFIQSQKNSTALPASKDRLRWIISNFVNKQY